MLLFGHNDNTPNQAGPQETSLTKRIRAIQENLELWWKIYHENFQKTTARDVNIFIFLKNDRFFFVFLLFFVSFSSRFKNYCFFKSF